MWQRLATIDFISQGRVTLGVGLGNREPDYDAMAVAFERRGARTRKYSADAPALARRLGNVQRGILSGAGRVVAPKPHRHRAIPIWMGGSAEPVLKRVALHAEGYFCSTSALANFAAIWEKL